MIPETREISSYSTLPYAEGTSIASSMLRIQAPFLDRSKREGSWYPRRQMRWKHRSNKTDIHGSTGNERTVVRQQVRMNPRRIRASSRPGEGSKGEGARRRTIQLLCTTTANSPEGEAQNQEKYTEVMRGRDGEAARE